MGQFQLALLAMLMALLASCSMEPRESKALEAFEAEADGLDMVIDRSILRVINTESDADFNALIKDLEKVKLLTSSGGTQGVQAQYKSLSKALESEGYTAAANFDKRETKCSLMEQVSDDNESSWVVLFVDEESVGSIEVQGGLDMKYIHSLKNINQDKLKGLLPVENFISD